MFASIRSVDFSTIFYERRYQKINVQDTFESVKIPLFHLISGRLKAVGYMI